MKMPPLTLGIEEEYQIINPETRNLHAYISELISQDEQKVNPLLLKAEFMQSQVEVGSHVCKNIKELRQEVIRLRRAVIKMAEDNDLRIVAASTHPFAKWEEQSITEGDRYRELLDNMQGVARRLLIFGMHVHVGFGITEDTPPAERLDIQNLMVEVMNQVRYFIPHILALSSSSPFWQGQMTGLKSYRSVIFEMLPRTGIPHAFTSWGEYENYARTLERVGAFGKKDKTAKIWWDIRPHPKFDTLEFRICDICTRMDDAITIAALFQALCAKIVQLRMQNMSWRPYRQLHITENKWRAMRHGVSGELIDFGMEEERPYHFLMSEMLDLVDDVVDDLGSREEIERVREICENGSSADRQLRAYRDAGGDDNREEALKAVVDHLIEDTKLGI